MTSFAVCVNIYAIFVFSFLLLCLCRLAYSGTHFESLSSRMNHIVDVYNYIIHSFIRLLNQSTRNRKTIKREKRLQ